MKRILFLVLVLLLVTACAGAQSGAIGNRAGQSTNAMTPPPLTGLDIISISEIRKKVPFPVFIPTQVPPGLAATVKLREEGTRALVDINYKTSDGSYELTVLNGPAGCCLDADPRKEGKLVKVRDNLTAHYLEVQPQFGGPTLWWQEAGTYIALSGSKMNKDDLVRIADSMSFAANP